jgi:hypothetical protein
MPITAFVDSLRLVNQPFLGSPRGKLEALDGINAEALDAFMEGLFVMQQYKFTSEVTANLLNKLFTSSLL